MSDETRIDEILGDWAARREEGEDVAPESVVAAHPDIADELRGRFAALELVDRALGVTAGANLPERIGDYVIECELGAGGMGTVYRAHAADGQQVAVKVVHPHLIERKGFFKRFLREAEIGRRVAHDNVIRVLGADVHVEDGVHHHFLVMEYAEGQNLRDLLDEMGALPEELVRHIGREVARALVVIHAAGAVHRDVKPENVLITPDDRIKIMDLGVAFDVQATLRLSQTGAFVGSVAYAAPEQLSGGDRQPDARTDLHALGLVLYELASGRHPFGHAAVGALIQRVLDETPRSLTELLPDVSPFLAELVGELLAKDPDARSQTAREVLETLEMGERSPWWARRERRRESTTWRPVRRPRLARETAVYGRDREIERLLELYREAKAGHGRVVLVDGEAGVGKTRLVDEAVARLVRDGEDLSFLFASYPPGGAATSAGALVEAYRDHLGPEGVARHLGESSVLAPAFDALLRSEPPPEGSEHLNKGSLQTCFTRVLQSIAEERPTVLLVEDLHFAPDDGRALFAALAVAVAEHPVLLVGTARPGIPAAWVADLERVEHVERLALGRLGPSDLHRLLWEAFQSERLAEDLGWRIARRSDGNPYFVFEILRDLRDRRALTQRPDGTWETSGALDEIRIPSSVLDLVRARVAELDEADRDLLDVAACCGFEFDGVLVGEAFGLAPIPVLKRLSNLEKRYRLVRSAGDGFTFDHHQVQEALYQGLPASLARAYHGAVADALVARLDHARTEVVELVGGASVELCRHALRGGQSERAAACVMTALRHLRGAHQPGEVLVLAERAIAEPGLLDDRAHAEVLVFVAEAADITGRRDRQMEAMKDAETFAAAANDVPLESWAASGLGFALMQAGQPVEAEKAMLRAERIARAGDNAHCAARAIGMRGQLMLHLGRLAEARVAFEDRRRFARAGGILAEEGLAAGGLGQLAWMQGRYEEALGYHREHLDLAVRAGHRQGEGVAVGNIGMVLTSLGRHEEAQEQLERQVTLTRSIGDRLGEARAWLNLGGLSYALGRLSDARDRADRHLRVCREVSFPPGEANGLSTIASISRLLGDHTTAAGLVGRALELSRARGFRQVEAHALRVAGELAWDRSDLGEAAARLIESAETWASLGNSKQQAALLRVLLSVQADGGDLDAARDTLTRVRELIEAHDLEGTAVLVDAVAAHHLGEDAASAAERYLAGEEGTIHEHRMLARYHLWGATGDLEHLRAARAIVNHFAHHAPPDSRTTLETNVALHRAIVMACRKHGVDGA